MVVINHQVEDDHSTTSIIAASKEDDLKREMIRLYQGKFEDDNNDGSRVSEYMFYLNLVSALMLMD
ncbi:hypothetical protein HanLR1_Chr02g0044401 [Helianthus annuus]|nr:hypothetical protein HanHA89_Chr02g0045881 [Helianthus annuus]KAJ0776332.1 hypothetical protein HanLR1_Chr02g0044401 [Helianthus annuus]